LATLARYILPRLTCEISISFDGRCYGARDPLLGTDTDRSNFANRLGDLLVQRRTFDRVILVPIANGASPVASWAPGGVLFRRLMEATRRVRAGGLEITLATWRQGAADAYSPSTFDLLATLQWACRRTYPAAHLAGLCKRRSRVPHDLFGNTDEHAVFPGLLLVALARGHPLDLIHPTPRRSPAIAIGNGPADAC